MNENLEASCCFTTCSGGAAPPTLRMHIWPPSDLPAVDTRAHPVCFQAARTAGVSPDPPGERGRIPPGAKCVFCGGKLPVVGRHPYALEMGEPKEPIRFWSHAGCLKATVKFELDVGLPKAEDGGRPAMDDGR